VKSRFLVSLLIALVVVMLAMPASAQDDMKSKPIQLSLITPIQIFYEEAPITGLRFNLLYGRQSSVVGLDIGLVNHTTSGVSKGFQYGLVGINDARFVGWADNFVNISKEDFEGLQTGFVNSANHCSGVQFGFVNYARTMNGLQIGLVNIIKSGGQFPVFPIVNWSF